MGHVFFHTVRTFCPHRAFVFFTFYAYVLFTVYGLSPNRCTVPQNLTIFQLELVSIKKCARGFCYTVCPNVFAIFMRLFTPRVSFIHTVCQFYQRSFTFALHRALIWGMLRYLVDLVGWVGMQYFRFRVRANTYQTAPQPKLQASSRPLIRLPILSCPPIRRIRMFRRKPHRLPHPPPRPCAFYHVLHLRVFTFYGSAPNRCTVPENPHSVLIETPYIERERYVYIHLTLQHCGVLFGFCLEASQI